MSVFTVEILGTELYVKKSLASEARVKNPRLGFARVGSYLMGRTKERFDAEGPGWAPLSENWAFYKQSHGFDERILRMHGTLFESVTRPEAPRQVLIITNNGLRFGTDLEYAGAHQEGTSRIPQRKFLEVDVTDRSAISQILATYFTAPFYDTTPHTTTVSGFNKSKNQVVFGEPTGLFSKVGQERLRGARGRFVGTRHVPS